MKDILLQGITGFMKYLGKVVVFILLLALVAVLYQYLTCPVYRFPEPEPFSGNQIFNPYDRVDSTSWRKANFQVQSYAWGGLTDGRGNSNEVIDSIYRALRYDIIAISDYQRINRWGEDEPAFIPVYEHGYGFFKNHQVLLGSRRVNWADFPVYQNLHHKQHILNILNKNNELVYIAHPGLRGAYKPEDMKYLTGYDGLEVLNYVIVSEAHWDSALSAGKYVTIMGNDDSHDVSNPLEVGHRCTFIHSPSLIGDSIISALKMGRAFGANIYRPDGETMAEKAGKAKDIAKLEYLKMAGDTLRVKVDRKSNFIRFIGQGGRVRQITRQSDSAMYVLKPEDTYIRTEILFHDRNMFYLNPVVRYDGVFPSNPSRASIDITRSWISWILSWATLVFILLNLYYLYRRWRHSRIWLRNYFSGYKYGKYLFILIIISLIIKGIIASVLELGNDEAYYWTYALFPDLGHFDHPPMVGWVIQFFTLDLLFQDEFFLRLPGLVLGSFNILLVYLIGRTLKDDLTGWYAALLFTASIYCFVLAGIFILPDTPQVFFWLLAVFVFLKPLGGNPDDAGNRRRMLLAGLVVGLAMLSKYTSVFLWGGALLFISIYNKGWLRSVTLYLSVLLTFLVFLPVIIWNFRNDFISFTFQGSRAGIFDGGIRPDFFFTELAGEFLYNNPVVFLLVLFALVAFFKRKELFNDRKMGILVLFWSLPLILVFLFISMFRQTLPHWTGPAYTTLIFLSAAYLRERLKAKRSIWLLPSIPLSALILLLTVLVSGVLQVNHGVLYTGKEKEMTERGRNDVSMDMYGWKDIRRAFRWLAADDESRGIMPKGAPIITHRWFPAANLDYYVARQTGKKVLAYGPLQSIHKYHWINEIRGGFHEGMDAYYITTSRDFKDPNEIFGDLFEEIDSGFPFPIYRGGKVAGYGFIYRLRGSKMSSQMTSYME